MNRRVYALLFVAILLLAMAACNKKKNTEATNTSIMIETIPIETTEETTPGSIKIDEIIMDPRTLELDEAETIEETKSLDQSRSATEEKDTITSANIEKNSPETTTVEETKETTPNEPQMEETTPTQTPTTSDKMDGAEVVVRALTEYEKYIAMSGDEQLAFMNTFTSVNEFIEWYNNAKAEYDSNVIIIDGSVIDVKEIVGN